MSRESLVLEFEHASAPLRRAATEEVIICRFGGVGPVPPRITRITVEYDDPRPRPEPVDPVNDIPANQPTKGVVPNGDLFQGHEGSPEFLAGTEPSNDDWAV